MSTTTAPPSATAAPAGYGFDIVLLAIKKGHKARRKQWPPSQYIGWDGFVKYADEEKPSVGNIYCMIGGNKTFMALHNRDILSTDWEIE